MALSTKLVSQNNFFIAQTPYQATNIDAFKARCKQLKPLEFDALQKCSQLETFLPKAIDFLQKNPMNT